MNKFLQQSIIRERISLLVLIVILALIALIGRLFEKQVLEHNYWLAQAASQQKIEKKIPSERGKILVFDPYSKNYFPLAHNLTLYALEVIPAHLSDPLKVSQKLAPILGKDPNEIYQLINHPDKLYLPPIARKLTDLQAKQIKKLKLEGVKLIPEKWRYYPEGTLAAHLLGFVDASGEGRYGIEGFYNAELKGRWGFEKGAKDVLGRELLVGRRFYLPPKDGRDIILTLDHSIQFIVEEKLKKHIEMHQAEGGGVIVMDPKTGAILALAAYPTFDPNKFSEITDYSIFNNPLISKLYEPGSVFKVITMAAALEENKVEPDTARYFTASVKVADRIIYTSNRKAHGWETMTEALETSDNVALVWVAQQLGLDLFYKYIKKFGFGTPTGIDLEGEEGGMIKPKDQLTEVDLATMSFGQGIAVTPIQLITAIAAIANEGKLVQPHVASALKEGDKIKKIEPKIIREVISKTTAQKLVSMLISVVEKGQGILAKVKGYKIAGKTGTAQIPRKDGGGYEEGKTICTFVGFAPADDPKFIILTRIDVPKDTPWAAETAAPLFKDIAKFLFNYYQIPPSD